jgi:hypothetical protein
MVAMGVGDQNMRHGFTAHRVEQRRDVPRVRGPGIDDRDPAATDDIAQRSPEGEGTGIVGEDAPHPWRDFIDHAGRKVENLVERNLVGHLVA